jgi:elongation factor Ts
MAEISAKDVAALRKVTGAGMMDCKRALEETSGDVEAAKTWLREKGLAAAGKRSGRAAEQGAVEVIYEDGRGAIAEVTCETDFVAKGAEFRAAVAALARQVLDKGDGDLASQPYIDDPSQTIGGVITALASKLGENIGIGRIVRFESDGGIVDGYKHIQNERGTIGVLVELGGVAPADSRAREVAHDIALHIASAAPRWVRKDDVPDDVIAAERQVLENLTRNEGKPEAAISKIVDGRIQGFYKDSVLLEQPFVRDAKTTVGQLLGSLGGDASVVRVARVKVGEE